VNGQLHSLYDLSCLFLDTRLSGAPEPVWTWCEGKITLLDHRVLYSVQMVHYG